MAQIKPAIATILAIKPNESMSWSWSGRQKDIECCSKNNNNIIEICVYDL